MNEHQNSVRRVFAAIDSSPFGSAALEAAALLATELHAELRGLFIEDINLFRVARMPFAKEVDSLSGTLRRLDVEELERALRIKAEGVRQAIADTAQRTSLNWSFRIFRGNVTQMTLAAALDADLLLIGRERSMPPLSPPVGQGPIMAVDDGTDSGKHVFDAAQRLARDSIDSIVVLATNGTEDDLDRYQPRRSATYVQRCAADELAVIEAARRWQPRLLLLDRDSPLVTESSIDAIVSRLPCPLVLVSGRERVPR